MEPIAKVASIFIYPIKSCRGISVSQAPLTPTGFRWDREWLVVNSKGRAYTQRVEPRLALVEVNLPHEAFFDDWELTNSSYLGKLAFLFLIIWEGSAWARNFTYDLAEIKAPKMGVLKVPLEGAHEVADDVSVWEWSGSALDEGAEAAKWFSDFLGKSSRLVRFNAAPESRAVDPDFAHGYNTMFSDGYPFMLISQGSLGALNKSLEEPVPINRFRPNIFVDGCQPFSEDLWKEIRINKFTFEGVKLCSRCKVPTINQDTGIAGSQPTETLKKIRSDNILRPNKKQQGKVYFGQNLVWKDKLNGGKGSIVQVGDPVFVLKQVSTAAEAAA